LAVGLGASSSSLSESSTTLRLRRFDGGAIAGDQWPGEHLFAGSVMWWPTVGDLVVVLDLGRHGPDCEVGLTKLKFGVSRLASSALQQGRAPSGQVRPTC
jgi:hypothetical protein